MKSAHEERVTFERNSFSYRSDQLPMVATNVLQASRSSAVVCSYGGDLFPVISLRKYTPTRELQSNDLPLPHAYPHPRSTPSLKSPLRLLEDTSTSNSPPLTCIMSSRGPNSSSSSSPSPEPEPAETGVRICSVAIATWKGPRPSTGNSFGSRRHLGMRSRQREKACALWNEGSLPVAAVPSSAQVRLCPPTDIDNPTPIGCDQVVLLHVRGALEQEGTHRLIHDATCRNSHRYLHATPLRRLHQA